MFISKNYPQNLNESVTIARHYGNGALEFQFKQDAQQLMHRHFQQCAQLIYLHQIPSLQTVDNRLLLFCIFYKQRLLHRLRTAFPTHHVNDIRRRRHCARYSLTTAETNLASAKVALKTLLELDITTDFDVADIDFDDAEIAAELPRKTTVFDTACSWMPALQRYKLAGEAEQYSIYIARGGYYPTVSLNAGVGTSNTSGSGNLGTQLKERLNEQISVTVSVPILDQKKNKTAVAKARIAQLNADLDYQEAMTSLSQTIEGIYIDAENAQSKYESCAEKLKSASLTDELVNEQFALGLVNTLDLLNAHSSLLTAQQELLQAKYLTILNKRLLNFYQTQQISL